MPHTPGPWFAVKGNEVHDRLTKFDEHGQRLGDTANGICQVEYPYGDAEGQAANSRLIAAAPELLEACEAAENWLGEYHTQYPDSANDYGLCDLLADLQRAIAKAKGDDPFDDLGSIDFDQEGNPQ